MNNKTLKVGVRALMVLSVLALVTGIASAQDESQDATGSEDMTTAYAKLGAGLALGLAGVGTGLSQGQIGAAAVGMIAEDGSKFVTGLIFTALPETIVLFGFLALFLL